MRRLATPLLLIGGGCGPLTHPMVERLPPEEQKQVDDAWQNMFSPPARLDRTLLLDVLITSQAHQRGVDRLDLVSEKCVGKGRAVMTVRFDREHPEFDEFVRQKGIHHGGTEFTEKKTDLEPQRHRDTEAEDKWMKDD